MQCMSVTQLAMIYVTVLHFVVDLDLGSVCFAFYTCICVDTHTYYHYLECESSRVCVCEGDFVTTTYFSCDS